MMYTSDRQTDWQSDRQTEERALQATRRRLAYNLAANPTLLVWRRLSNASSRGKEDSMDLTEKPPHIPDRTPQAPKTGDVDKTALVHHKIMTEADQNVTNLKRTTGAPGPQK